MTKQEFIDNINSEVFNSENKLSFITNFKDNKDLDNLFTIEDLYKLLNNVS